MDMKGVEVREAGGHGLGVFAVHAVLSGERLLAERPLLEWGGTEKEDLRHAVDALDPASQTAYWALCQNAEHGHRKTAFGVWISNALPTEDEPAKAAVFRVASRCNHSCQPNAHIHWNSWLQRMTVHAITGIAPGEEVRVDYCGDDGEPWQTRQVALLRDFGFECRCELCVCDLPSRIASDERRRRIIALGERIVETPCPPDLIEIVAARLQLMEAEGRMLATAWDTYAAASDFLQCSGDASGAAVWAARAAACAERALGRDSDEWRKYSAVAGPAACSDGAVAPFEVRRTACSGIGLYATRLIGRGECLLSEAPIATWRVKAGASDAEKAASFDAMAAQLTSEQVDAILQLSQDAKYGEVQTLLGTWQTNGLPINYERVGAGGQRAAASAADGHEGNAQGGREAHAHAHAQGGREAAVFATICRLNHACAPNCHAEWNARMGREAVHALRDISAGEELTISYLPPRGSVREARQKALLERFGFKCACALCVLQGNDLARSDARQRAIGELSRDGEPDATSRGRDASVHPASLHLPSRPPCPTCAPALLGPDPDPVPGLGP